ncbi:APC family permease [Nocardioides nematodiphilus]|uniref:APC family permease n=1 Tax=Nocardioides nematodiphilus TaxID=2849669 RepID=UPI001CD9D6F3|nr:amino acid permease [Nocardioides nematodiphilus]MCA1984754.1 amino acid permease [Nocardioides nematodiphilus]
MSLLDDWRHQGARPKASASPSVPTDGAGATLGLSHATALVTGSIIGVGIFSLPYAVASYGPISLVALAVATVGAVALAFMFAVLARRMPAAGGPYAYVRAAFGNGWGFSQAWLYWITAWAGNAAIAVGWVFYVEKFVNRGGATGWSIVIALAGLWIPAAVNLSGVRNMGVFQVWSTVLKFVPLLLMSTVGLFFIRGGNFTPWNTSGGTSLSAIGGAMAICLFSYLGLETASVAASQVRDPGRNVPRATILGTVGSAVVYLLSMIAVFGIMPAAQLADPANQASYSAATNAVVGGSWAGNLVAIAVVISGVGALNGWTMICAEMPRAATENGLFPTAFSRLSRRGVPAFGIVSSTLLASVAVVISYLGTHGATVFTTLVLMTGITSAIPYAFSALAQIKGRWLDHRAGSTSHLVRDVAVALTAFAMSVAFVYYSRNTGHVWYVTWGPFLMAAGAALLGIPVYLAERRNLGANPPAPLTERSAS